MSMADCAGGVFPGERRGFPAGGTGKIKKPLTGCFDSVTVANGTSARRLLSTGQLTPETGCQAMRV